MRNSFKGLWALKELTHVAHDAQYSEYLLLFTQVPTSFAESSMVCSYHIDASVVMMVVLSHQGGTQLSLKEVNGCCLCCCKRKRKNLLFFFLYWRMSQQKWLARSLHEMGEEVRFT